MADSESDDSDGEGGLGNVSRVVMRPPGHSGKAKKGHLCFDASFETGNLGKVDLISDFEYDLYIRPDTCNPYHRMWFNFVVDNTKLDQRVMFHIINISKPRNLFCDGMTPIVKSSSKKKWIRMPPHQVYFYQSPYHDNHYVLTLSFCFDKEEEGYQFAYSYPYSYSKHQAHLEHIEQRKLPHFKRELLTNSLQKRRIDIVTITNPENMENPEKIRVVVIFSRVHPGDSPTSFICQGMIDFLISNHPIAEKLRKGVVFKIVPMINPDGVVLGNFRSNWLGSDFERYWSRISPWSHPPLHAAFESISNLNKDKNVELDFVIDLHAHCSLRGIFVHGNTYQNVYRQERHVLFPKLLSQNVDGYEPEYCVFNREKLKRNTCRRFFSNLKENINCYSIYASFYGYTHNETHKLIHFDEESYYRLGRNIGRTFADYYTYLGVISLAAKKAPRKAAKKSDGRGRRKKMAARVAFSKVRKKGHKRRRRIRRAKVPREATATQMQGPPEAVVRTGHVDFSDVQFPPISDQKPIKRKLLPARQPSTRTSILEKPESRLSSDLKILKIG